MERKYFLILFGLSFVILACGKVQPLKDKISFVSVFNKFDTSAALNAAEEILADLKKFVSDSDYDELGFNSLADVQDAAPGTPVRVFTILYSTIESYDDDLDTKDYVVKDEYVHFPVKVHGIVTASLELFKDSDNVWKFARFGNPIRAQLISAVSDSLSHLPLPLKTSFFYLQIPSKYMSFLGYYDEADSRMYISPLADRARNELAKWGIYDAKSVLKMLK